MALESSGKRLMFVVTEDWYFLSHRLPLARAAKKAGYQVFVATRIPEDAEPIEREGFIAVPLRKMRRTGRNPFGELAAIAELAKLYTTIKPDIVHHVALKPVLYGSLAARWAGTRAVVNNLAGLGFVFSSSSVAANVLRPLIKFFLAAALRRGGTLTIVQNADDARALADIGVARGRIRLIKGSGVNPAKFDPTHRQAEPPIVLLASRMIRDKGIEDFVQAATRLRRAGVAARFMLLGAPDPGNPDSIPHHVLQGYNTGGVVEWWGYRSDMPGIIGEAVIVCLPTTYGEGIPKILIEAAAGARAIVAYDVAGVREIVTHGDNGLLVAAGDIVGLASAIEELLAAPERRSAMGANGRRRVEAEFTEAHVVAQTLDAYRDLGAA